MSIIEDAEEEESKQSKYPEKRLNSRESLSLGGSGSSDEDGSSIDVDDDEDKIYQQILAQQANT